MPSSDEQHPYFPSGEWEGHYLQNGHRGPMNCQLSFTDGNLSGSGGDDIGSYRFVGTYDVATMHVKMIKEYHGRHAVIYDGMADESGIYGQWSIPPWASGGFHIWPKKGKEETVEEAVVEEEKVLQTTALL